MASYLSRSTLDSGSNGKPVASFCDQIFVDGAGSPGGQSGSASIWRKGGAPAIHSSKAFFIAATFVAPTSANVITDAAALASTQRASPEGARTTMTATALVQSGPSVKPSIVSPRPALISQVVVARALQRPTAWAPTVEAVQSDASAIRATALMAKVSRLEFGRRVLVKADSVVIAHHRPARTAPGGDTPYHRRSSPVLSLADRLLSRPTGSTITTNPQIHWN